MEFLMLMRILVFAFITLNLILISTFDIKYRIIPHKLNISLCCLNVTYFFLNFSKDKLLGWSIILSLTVLFLLVICLLERKKMDGEEEFGWGDRFLILSIAIGMVPSSFIYFVFTLTVVCVVLIFIMFLKKKKEISMGEFICFSYGVAITYELILYSSNEKMLYAVLAFLLYVVLYFVFTLLSYLLINDVLIESKNEESCCALGDDVENK